MTSPATLAVSGASGFAISRHLEADALGLQRSADFDGQPADLVPELEAHARLAAVDADARGWILADAAVMLSSIHGKDWLDHVPSGEDGQPLLAPGSWANARTSARRWPDRAVRGRWQQAGLSRAHLTALNSAAKRSPAAALDWLEQAAANGWSVAALRRAMRGHKAPAPAVDPAELTLPDDLAATLRAELETAGIVLLSDVWYAATASLLLTVVDRHRRIEAGDDAGV